jgi:plastocyanin
VKGRGTTSRILLGVCAAAAAFGLVQATSAVGGDDARASATRSVSVRDDFFSPKRRTIASGDRVRWVWREDNPHNVRFRRVPNGASKRPGSTTKSSGTFVRKFRRRGTYRYVCTIHEDAGMTGSVKVE